MSTLSPVKQVPETSKERYIAAINKGIAVVFYRLANAYKNGQIPVTEFNAQVKKWHIVYKKMLNSNRFINKDVEGLKLLEIAAENFTELAEGFIVKKADQNQL